MIMPRRRVREWVEGEVRRLSRNIGMDVHHYLYNRKSMGRLAKEKMALKRLRADVKAFIKREKITGQVKADLMALTLPKLTLTENFISVPIQDRRNAAWRLSQSFQLGGSKDLRVMPCLLNSLVRDPEFEVKRIAAEALETIIWHAAEGEMEMKISTAKSLAQTLDEEKRGLLLTAIYFDPRIGMNAPTTLKAKGQKEKRDYMLNLVRDLREHSFDEAIKILGIDKLARESLKPKK